MLLFSSILRDSNALFGEGISGERSKESAFLIETT